MYKAIILSEDTPTNVFLPAGYKALKYDRAFSESLVWVAGEG